MQTIPELRVSRFAQLDSGDLFLWRHAERASVGIVSLARICDAQWDPRVRGTVGDRNDREETSGHFGIFFATWRRKGDLGRAFALAMRDPLNERRVLARRDNNQQYDKGYYHILI